jgi:hypothetical protein
MIRKIASKILSEPAKKQIRRAKGKSAEDVARFAVRSARRKRQERDAGNRFRSSYNVFGRLAEVPAVRYSVLSDPVAARTLLDSPKGQELIASRSIPATTPMSSQFLGLLANQPERIAEFLERPDIRIAMRQTGVSTRVGTDWIRVALDLNDRRAVDLLTDIAGGGVQTLLSSQNFVRCLVAHLADSSTNYSALQALLESVNRFDPLALHSALPQTSKGANGSVSLNGSVAVNGSALVNGSSSHS